MMDDHPAKKLFKTIQSNKAFRISLSLILLVAMVIITINLDIDQAQAILEKNQSWAFFIGVLIYFILGFTLIPTAPLTMFNAILFGPVEGIAIAVTGNMISALVGYQLGKTLVIAENMETFKQSLPRWVRKYTITSPIVLMIGRLLPMGRIPLSYLCGAYRVPFIRYCWSTLLICLFTASFLSFFSIGLEKFSIKLF